MLSIINFQFELFQLSTIEMIILELHPLERRCLIHTHSKRILYLLLRCLAVFDGTLSLFLLSILFKLSFFTWNYRISLDFRHNLSAPSHTTQCSSLIQRQHDIFVDFLPLFQLLVINFRRVFRFFEEDYSDVWYSINSIDT